DFSQLRHNRLDAMLKQECLPNGAICSGMVGCSFPPEYICHDCDDGASKCGMCAIDGHRRLPCHRLTKWNGKSFEKWSLESMGLVFGMNHSGEQCPHENTDSGSQILTVMDTNSLHNVQIGWCRCARAPELHDQLLNVSLIPATTLRPVTAFTFRVMKLFHMLNLVGQLTPWDFCGMIQRLTDNADSRNVQDVYRQFNQIQCQWRAVRAWKHAGMTSLNAESPVIGIGMDCVSCPMPGINIPKNWREDPDAGVVLHIESISDDLLVFLTVI
ncbi:hypothetical protein BU17DRAFT_46186, partial [Hysterangium stoloniferum]